MAKGDRGDPSDAAGWLASCVAAIDIESRRKWKTREAADLAQRMLAHSVESFVAAFRSALALTVPKLPDFCRENPVRHAGISGSSYHEVVCRLALRQHRGIWLWVFPEDCCEFMERRKSSEFEGLTGDEFTADDVLKVWDALHEEIATQFVIGDAVDADFLCAGIESERGDVADHDWPTITEAAREQGIDHVSTIIKAIDSGQLHDNGKRGKARRVNPSSLIRWSLDRRRFD